MTDCKFNLLIHEMRLEHQEEDVKWIVEGRANRNQFLALFSRHKGRT